MCLITIGQPAHTRHNTEDIVVNSVDTDFSSVDTLNSRVREDKLESSVVNTREIAGARWLVFFWTESERVNINTRVWAAGVVLEWLN